MATVVNNPPGESTSNGSGFLLGVIVLIILAVLLFAYGIPGLRDRDNSGTNVNVPDRINVDVNEGATP